MAAPPDLESLQLLVGVGRRGSLTAAAAELGISQPAASKRMDALERRLGLRLLVRSRRGSELTPEGTLVCAWAGRVMDELGVLLDGAKALQRERSAQMSVAASLTVAEHLLPVWIGKLRAAAPHARIALQVMNSTHVRELVTQGLTDLGFIEAPGVTPGLRSRAVARDRLVLVVLPTHRWARRRRPVTPAELAETGLVTREEGSGTRETADRALAALGFTSPPPLLELGSSAAVRSAVLAEAGPALISELVVAGDLAAGTLIEVPTSDLPLERVLRAVWRSGAQPTGLAAHLLAIATRLR